MVSFFIWRKRSPLEFFLISSRLFACSSSNVALIFCRMAFLGSLFISSNNFLLENLIRTSRVFLYYYICDIWAASLRAAYDATKAQVYSGYFIIFLSSLTSDWISSRICRLVKSRGASPEWLSWCWMYCFRSARTLRSACNLTLTMYPEEVDKAISRSWISI
jgi:hypothetical protein